MNPVFWGAKRTRKAGRAGDQETGPLAGCPHCGASGYTWSAEMSLDLEAMYLCNACGGWIDAEGQGLLICPACTFPRRGDAHDECRASGDVGPIRFIHEDHLGDKVVTALLSRFPERSLPVFERYLGTILEQVGAPPGPRILFVEMELPAIAYLPDDGLVLSLPLLGSLEDEAQLAFLLARELALYRAGYVTRRFGNGLEEPPRGILARWRRPRETQLFLALDLALKVGYGLEAERWADAQALSDLVRADYDPQGSGRALRRLESTSLSGRGARFVLAAERAAWLERSAHSLGRPVTARINREVYRRVQRTL